MIEQPDPEIRKEVARRIKKELLTLNLPMKVHVRSRNGYYFSQVQHIDIIFLATEEEIKKAFSEADYNKICEKYSELSYIISVCVHKSYLKKRND